MKIGPYTTNKDYQLPKIGSWPAAWHEFDESSAYALIAAEAARRPLLVRGEPGTGKSQLARAAAVATGRLFLSEVVNSRTEATDLQWHYDAVARLGEAQTLGDHLEEQEIQRLMNPKRFLTPGSLWWAFSWNSAQTQWNRCASPLQPVPERQDDWSPQQGSVLLIDEIDKADADLPNGLLETLGNDDFSVPYLKNSVRNLDDDKSVQQPPPLVIITTNEERELPAAFLRRCVVLSLELPDDDQQLIEQLVRRGRAHVGGKSNKTREKIYQEAAEQLLRDRKSAKAQGQPPPGQAEYLDLLRAVFNTDAVTSDKQRLDLLHKLSQYMLKKSPDLRD